MKSVDIVIPCYNEERVLGESVEKLRAWSTASLPYKWRIVIADNASTDGTLGVAERLAAEHPEDVAYIHLDAEGARTGVAARVPGFARGRHGLHGCRPVHRPGGRETAASRRDRWRF